MTAAIEAEGLVKSYPAGRGAPRLRALDGLGFEAASGGVFAMLGPNGAGKSTTTRILTTLSRADAGTARVGGFDVAREAGRVRELVGCVSQGTGVDPVLTATENLVMAARLRGYSGVDARRRAAALLGEFDLADAAARRAGTFSGGMKRRLDVAVALVHGPGILFLDEPTTGLDPESRTAMWAEIRRLAAERTMTVVLTTHYLEEADRLADDVMIVDAGRRVVQGSPERLKATLAGDSLSVELLEPRADAVRAAIARVPGLEAVAVESRGTTGRLTARAADAPAVVGATIAALEAAGIPFGSVSAARPSLDDVYLHYVGRSLTADSTEEGAAA
ncbi:ABC transporter ATP-binding protein [Galbitalea sp. SE-J8]|uniref:ABC transporter ATP-binding protein n=1 Tax=Galbitalea sp. SE-J8 TaxID=3054952 RepID=UPI00259C82F9|nr:ABC transporter ATP-binding protein [Galbitalea sp. SE-J8]MDM4762750.1 ABC transporter ATP-binding protein [Galbitalea sp. SE-J8]